MAIDQEQRDVILDALQTSDVVDSQGIDVVLGEDTMVLRGTVATFEQSDAAEHIASQHAEEVRNELRVDPNTREGVGDETLDADERRAAALQYSVYNPADRPGDLVSDVQESLDENVPWQPPNEPVEVPTRAEERGREDRPVDVAPAVDDDEVR